MTTAPNFNPDELVRVSSRQREGADAGTNAWVSASAGAGKTRVLRDRVLRLLMAGVAPSRILCLTFTKAAAAEMSRRINDELGAWTVADDATLHAELANLFGAPPEPDDLLQARRLFARVLDAPGGMNIMTIHAFCQSVLRRFPLEAGVAPYFKVMEDRDAAELLDDAKADMLADAQAADSILGAAMTEIASRVHELRFPELLGEITRARTRFAGLFEAHGGVEGATDRLAAFLGVEPDITEADVLAEACGDLAFDAEGLRRAVAALSTGSRRDVERGAKIGEWLAADGRDRATSFGFYCGAFLTQSTGDLYKTLVTKPVREANPGVEDILVAEGERLRAVRDLARKASLLAANRALAHVAADLIARYEARKSASGRLDYEDLINKTRALLVEAGPAWVLYKLDGGIDHVLIDEAQDTNPEQWDVVDALVDEFFSGAGARDESTEQLGLPLRSVFAVGDVKQSIYSFQGAEPRRFMEMRARLSERALAAERRWSDVELNFSFRSARPVLEAVDKVFERDGARAGVVNGIDRLIHTALRDRDAGLVELWPPVVSERGEEPEPWKPPVDPVSLPGERDRLAAAIADQIGGWLAEGEMLESQGRPIDAGDIMVLVRQRGPFVDTLVRALKERGIPVAGVDRMVLTEQIAVMDLLSLGAFLLLPEDDLNLAALLKSPLFGLGEQDLFDLAHNRGDVSLWEALLSRRSEPGLCSRAAGQLSDLLARVDYERPYELFAGVLSRGGREALVSRLGPDAADAIDEFLALALSFEANHPPSMQAFLHWVVAGDAEVKRDLDQTGDAVRVMTVHGAKGLEAPVVFLPDTTRLPRKLPGILWHEDGSVPFFVWLPRVEDGDAASLGLRDMVQLRRDEEYRRLLYVAMTRAEERLYLCGWGKPADRSWYALAADAMEQIARPLPLPGFLDAGPEHDHILRLVSEQRAPVPSGAAEVAVPPTPVPRWIDAPAPDEPDPPRPLAPSDPGAPTPVRAPVERQADELRFARGNVLHRLLQWLPELDPASRRAAAQAYVSRPVVMLGEDARNKVVEEVMAVLDAPDFAYLFGPDSLAEVAVTGVIEGTSGIHRIVSGQIDRLVVAPDRVSIVDYKSNRPPPVEPAHVAPVYLRQLAAYRHIVRRTWPDRPVDAYLLWTDGPRLMRLPDSLLDANDPAEYRTSHTSV
ncbi:MAG: double-strand break repair helicase AddA [Alphaproteobacteria bacterium]|nr:double-strand break repair helicase AddA [Alphaproteobacteria bacterium]